MPHPVEYSSDVLNAFAETVLMVNSKVECVSDKPTSLTEDVHELLSDHNKLLEHAADKGREIIDLKLTLFQADDFPVRCLRHVGRARYVLAETHVRLRLD